MTKSVGRVANLAIGYGFCLCRPGSLTKLDIEYVAFARSEDPT